MSFFTTIRSKLQGARTKFASFVTFAGGGVPEGSYVKKGDDRVGSWVNALYEDAKNWRQQYFNSGRDSRFGYSDPMVWGRKISEIESGNHWVAWGSRKLDPEKDAWKSEMVDDETTDQMRLRNSHLTGSWHDVQVLPNIKNMDDILRGERKKSRWGSFISLFTKTTQKYGEAWARSYLDKSEYKDGIANERVCRYGSIFLSPKATGKLKNDGCWYVAEARMEAGQWVRENFPTFKLSEIGSGGLDVRRDISLERSDATYNHTKEYAVIEIFCDDPTIEKAPFDRAKFEHKIALILAGEEVKVDEWKDNHKEYVKAYEQYVDDLVTLAEGLSGSDSFTSEDEETLDVKVELIQAQIMQHVEVGSKSEYPEGKREKYINGRHIITIDGVVAFDEPNEYECEWRSLIHRLKNEDVPDRVDGRGDVEILWNAQKALDENLSRFADAALLAAIPKKMRHVSDKEIIEKQGGENNDPAETDYFVQTPPTYVKAPPPTELLKMYEMQKQNAKQKGADTNVARGNAPTASASGDLADALAAQNDVVMQGELATNMIAVLEDIIETKLVIMRKFYTEPRCYLVNGKEEYLTVSRVLATTTVEDPETGESIEKDVEKFEITVVPSSNAPNKWEREVSTISTLQRTLLYPDGTPAIPIEAVIDKIAERYPQFGRDGKYATINQAARIGMQILMAKQAEQEMVAGIQPKEKMNRVKERVKKQVPAIADTIPGNMPLNGNGT